MSERGGAGRDMRTDPSLRTSEGPHRHARPRQPEPTNTAAHHADHGLARDIASEGRSESLFNRMRKGCQQQFGKLLPLTREKKRFKTELQALSTELQGRSLTQSNYFHSDRLRMLQQRFDTRLRPQMLKDKASEYAAEEYAAELEDVRQHLSVRATLKPIHEVRTTFIRAQALHSRQSDRLERFGKIAGDRLNRLTETQAQIDHLLSRNSAPAAQQALNAELENIAQEVKSLTLFCDAQDFFDNKLKVRQYPTHQDTPTATQARRDYEALLAQSRELQVSASRLAQSQDSIVAANYSASPLMGAANDYLQAIEATMLSRDALETIESDYNTLQANIQDLSAEELAAHVDRLRDKITSGIDYFARAHKPQSENSLLTSHDNYSINAFSRHMTCFEFFRGVDQLLKAFDQQGVDKFQLLKTCVELKDKLDALDEKAPKAPSETAAVVRQVISVYEQRLAAVTREICLQCADLTQQSLAHERNNFDLETTLSEGVIGGHTMRLEIAENNIKSMLKLDCLTTGESGPLRSILGKLDIEITLKSELNEICDTMATFLASLSGDARVKSARKHIAQHKERLQHCRERMDGADEMLVETQRVCERTLLTFHQEITRVYARETIEKAALKLEKVKETLIGSMGEKTRLRSALQRYTQTLTKLESEKSLLDSETYNAVVAEKDRCIRARAKVDIALTTEQLREMIEDIEGDFEFLAIPPNEVLKLENFLHDLVDEVLQGRARISVRETRLLNLLDNMGVALTQLTEQLDTITYTRHLSERQKEALAQWCSRLTQNPVALRASNSDQVRSFADMVSKPLKAIEAKGSALAKELVSKVTDAECTDWASKVLIDMQAIMLSHNLSDALSKQLGGAGQETGESRLKTLEAFIDTHRKDFVSLLNFSAFQAKTQEQTVVDRSNKESLQAYLWLYLTAKNDFPLPGDVTMDHMAYRGYSVKKVLGGEDGAQNKYQIVKNALEDAQGPLKGHHLNQLEFWGARIWKEVLAALPDQDREAALAAQNSKMAQLNRRFETLEKQHAAGNISQAEYNSEIESIGTERRALENVQSESQAQYAERLMARISD